MVTYGHQVAEKDDYIIGLNERSGTYSATLGSPGSTIVDFFPFRTFQTSRASLQGLMSEQYSIYQHGFREFESRSI